jgi:hypothetical protein
MNTVVMDIMREIGTDECVAAMEAQEFTAEEEAVLAATVPNTARLSLFQLQGYRDAYKPSTAFASSYTRQDALSYEAIRRELVKRGEKA